MEEEKQGTSVNIQFIRCFVFVYLIRNNCGYKVSDKRIYYTSVSSKIKNKIIEKHFQHDEVSTGRVVIRQSSPHQHSNILSVLHLSDVPNPIA